MTRILPAALLALLPTLVPVACDSYDAGDGPYSNMRADFVELFTDAGAMVTAAETDAGEMMDLSTPLRLSWAGTPDSAYRALLYYDRVERDGGSPLAEPLSVVQVAVLPIMAASDFGEGVVMDPLTLESAWMSKQGKYLNLDLVVKVGSLDGEGDLQILGVAYEGVERDADGTNWAVLRLYHSQNGMPEYYSSETFASIPMESLPVNPRLVGGVTLLVNTYGGEVSRTFPLE